jgi:hypothetical protein
MVVMDYLISQSHFAEDPEFQLGQGHTAGKKQEVEISF